MSGHNWNQLHGIQTETDSASTRNNSKTAEHVVVWNVSRPTVTTLRWW